MYKHILVALDGSSSSRRALNEAINLCKLSGGVLHPLCVVDKSPLCSYAGYYDPITYIDAVRKDGRTILEKAEKTCAAADIPCCAELLESNNLSEDIASVVLRYATEINAELVVMGTHGRRGMRRLVIGSVAEQVLRYSRCPVVVVRDAEPPRREDARSPFGTAMA